MTKKNEFERYGQYCCKEFDNSEIIEKQDEPEGNISYYLCKYNDELIGDIIEEISYCPFCGAKV